MVVSFSASLSIIAVVCCVMVERADESLTEVRQRRVRRIKDEKLCVVMRVTLRVWM